MLRLFHWVELFSTKTLAPTSHAKQKAAQKLDPSAQVRLRAASCTVLIDAAADLCSAPAPDLGTIVAAAKAFLEARCQEPLRISDLVNHLGYSRARVFDLFKAGTGMTPNDYLLRCRVHMAEKLLSDTDQSVTEIALTTGFSSSQYFCKVFRKYTGQSPSHFRKPPPLPAT